MGIEATRLAALREVTAVPADWDDPEWIGNECRRCNSSMSCPSDMEPAPTCNSCAQDVLSQVREILSQTVRTSEEDNCGFCRTKPLAVFMGRCTTCGRAVPEPWLSRCA